MDDPHIDEGLALMRSARRPALGTCRRAAAAEEKKVVIGVQCDRTGPTQIVGTVLCPAMQDYFTLRQFEGRRRGLQDRGPEIDTGYKVPPAVEAYERQKQQGAVIMSVYGTPQTHALNERLEDDQMPTTIARLRHRRLGRRRAVSRICSRSPRPISRRAPPRSISPRASWAAI